MFLVNSRLGRFAATPFSSDREDHHLPGAPLLPKLRGQFAEFLNERSLAHLRILSPSTCVGLRYGHPIDSPTRFFLAVCLGPVYALSAPHHTSTFHRLADLPTSPVYVLEPAIPTAGWSSLLRHPLGSSTNIGGTGIFNPFSIDYAFRPRLRSRLTLSRRTLLRKP